MIVLISKRLPPTRCGIGDYTRYLADELAQRGAQVAGIAWESPSGSLRADAGFPIEYLAAPTAALLVAAIAKTAVRAGQPVEVILQTSQYDAHPRGLAGWLARGLHMAQASGQVRRSAVMIHEIWLPELARRRDVWTYPWQRASFSRLVRQADAVAVTTATYARRVEHLAPTVSPAVLPVFSNFEEPPPPLVLTSAREAGAWAVFGSTLRLRVGLPSLLEDPRAASLRKSIAKLEVFGGDSDDAVAACLARHRDLPQSYQPSIPAALAGELLRKCHATWIDYRESQYDPSLLGKSTLLATALANGCLPVLAHSAGGFTVSGEPLPYWYSGENPPPPAGSAAAHSARAANLDWYHRHASRQVHAGWYEKALLVG